MAHVAPCFVFFFFKDTATTEIYTLSLHDALPISISDDVDRGKMMAFLRAYRPPFPILVGGGRMKQAYHYRGLPYSVRSEEHTSELQSRLHLVCRLLLEKKKCEVRGTAAPGRRLDY